MHARLQVSVYSRSDLCVVNINTKTHIHGGALKMQLMEIARNGKRKENASFLQGVENARNRKCKEWKMQGNTTGNYPHL